MVWHTLACLPVGMEVAGKYQRPSGKLFFMVECQTVVNEELDM